MNFIFLTFIEVSVESLRDALEQLRSYFDECQKNKIYFLIERVDEPFWTSQAHTPMNDNCSRDDTYEWRHILTEQQHDLSVAGKQWLI